MGAAGPLVADASPDLPGITAQELLTKVQTAKVDGLSGTVRSVADLGLPTLPGADGDSQVPDLLSGEHTARVAFAGPDKARVSVLDHMAERVWTTDGTTAWAYDSARREAVKLTLPKRPAGAPEPKAEREAYDPQAEREAYDPQAVAKKFLDAVDPSTTVDVTGTERVAGRDAYKLRLVPRTDKTTVGSVTVAVDAKTWVPLEVTVLPRTGDDPAVRLGFSSVAFGVPAAGTFTFTPPKGVNVTEKKVPAHKPPTALPKAPDTKPGAPKAGTPKPGSSADRPAFVGEGWETVVVLRGVKLTPGNGPLDQLLANARTVQGSWGSGKILTSKMVSALITDDGRVLTGLVTPDALLAAAPKAPR